MTDSDPGQKTKTGFIANDKFMNVTLFVTQVILIFLLLFYYLWIGLVFTAITITYTLSKEIFSTNDIVSFIKVLLEKRTLKKFLIIFMITISGLVILLNEIHNDTKTEKTVVRYFNGFVWDEVSELLPDVIIFLPELNVLDTTDNQGRFSFVILDTTLKSISFIARKEGYKTYEAEGSIGNPNYNFNMMKK